MDRAKEKRLARQRRHVRVRKYVRGTADWRLSDVAWVSSLIQEEPRMMGHPRLFFF